MFLYNYFIFTESKTCFSTKKCEELCLKETVQEGGFKIIPRLLYVPRISALFQSKSFEQRKGILFFVVTVLIKPIYASNIQTDNGPSLAVNKL